MQKEKHNHIMLWGTINNITSYDDMLLDDFMKAAERITHTHHVYLQKPVFPAEGEEAVSKLLDSIKKIDPTYFPDGFLDYINNYDDFSCDLILYPMEISQGTLKNFKRNYNEYYNVTTALYGKIDEYGNIDITPITKKKKIKKHEYINAEKETQVLRVFPNDGLERMFTAERDQIKISDIKSELHKYDFRVATNEQLISYQHQKTLTLIEKEINKLVKSYISNNDGYENVNWEYDYPTIYLVPVWRVSFNYDGHIFDSVFSDDLTQKSLCLPYKKDPVVEYVTSEKSVKIAKTKQKCFAIASIVYFFLCLVNTIPSLFMASSGMAIFTPELIRTLIICYATFAAAFVGTRNSFMFVPFANELSSGTPYLAGTLAKVKAKVLSALVITDALFVLSFGSLIYNAVIHVYTIISVFSTMI